MGVRKIVVTSFNIFFMIVLYEETNYIKSSEKDNNLIRDNVNECIPNKHHSDEFRKVYS